MNRLRLKPLRIPFKVAFRHASAARAETSSVWVDATGPGGVVGYGEGCPREYVTGESLDSASAFFECHEEELRGIDDLSALQAWVETHNAQIDANPAAWCAVELAILDLLARQDGRTLESFL